MIDAAFSTTLTTPLRETMFVVRLVRVISEAAS